MIIATHSGKFHGDEIWAVATLQLIFPNSVLVRTRDSERIDNADLVVDVGGVWQPDIGRFDHHQKDFGLARATGAGYASAGLVWKEYGPRCVSLIAQQYTGQMLPMETAREIAFAIDTDLVQYLDLADIGAAKSAPGGYGLSAIISGFNPSWIDERNAGSSEAAEAVRLSCFRRALEFATDILVNNVKYRVGAVMAVNQVRRSELLENGYVLFLPNSALPWAAVVRREMPKVIFVISHNIAENRYMVHTVPLAPESFEARKNLPKAWGGLRDEELQALTGVPDAQFCHKGLFIAAARSFEGSLRLVRLALAED
jgi:uncharacterized UPF0160 family protein